MSDMVSAHGVHPMLEVSLLKTLMPLPPYLISVMQGSRFLCLRPLRS